MKSMLSTAVVLSVFTTAVIAQQPPAPRKPGAEEKRIGYFAGTWNFTGETKPSPMGPGGKMSATENCEMFAGGFQLVCKSKGTGPMGPSTGQAIMAYDPGRKTYTYHAISSRGDVIFVRGNVSGKVWTWEDEITMEGKPMKIRATVTEETATSYSFKLESSIGGGPMAVMEEGKATKAKSGTTP